MSFEPTIMQTGKQCLEIGKANEFTKRMKWKLFENLCQAQINLK